MIKKWIVALVVGLCAWSSQAQNSLTSTIASPSDSDRYLIHKSGTLVFDSTTKLVWQRCSLGQKWDGLTCTGLLKKFTHDQAIQAAKAFNETSGSMGNVWEVPTIRQLASLLFCSRGYRLPETRIDVLDGGPRIQSVCAVGSSQPPIDSLAMPGTPLGDFRSTSSWVSGDRRWGIDFTIGQFFGSGPGDNDSHYVRLVRVGVLTNDLATEGFGKEQLSPMDQAIRTAKNAWTSNQLTQETQEFVNFSAANNLAYSVYKGGTKTSFSSQKACSLETQNLRQFVVSGAGEIWNRHGGANVDELHSISEEQMFWIGYCVDGKANGQGVVVYFYQGAINRNSTIGAVRSVITVSNGIPLGTVYAYSNSRTCFNDCNENRYAKVIGTLAPGSAGLDRAKEDLKKQANQSNYAMGQLLGGVLQKAGDAIKQGAATSSGARTSNGSTWVIESTNKVSAVSWHAESSIRCIGTRNNRETFTILHLDNGRYQSLTGPTETTIGKIGDFHCNSF